MFGQHFGWNRIVDRLVNGSGKLRLLVVYFYWPQCGESWRVNEHNVKTSTVRETLYCCMAWIRKWVAAQPGGEILQVKASLAGTLVEDDAGKDEELRNSVVGMRVGSNWRQFL